MFFFSIIIYCFTRSSDTKVDPQDKIEEASDDKKGRQLVQLGQILEIENVQFIICVMEVLILVWI